MNILVVIFDNINVAGGGPEVIKQVAPRLSARGHHVSVITSKNGTRNDMNANNYLMRYGIDVTEIDLLSPTSIPTFRAKKIIKKKIAEADIVYFFLYMGGLERYLLKLQNKLHKPVISGHHGMIDNSNPKISFLQRLYYAIYGDRGGRSVKKFVAQHVLNKEDFETLINRRFTNVFLIPNGINPERYNRDKKKGDKFTILFLGRLSEEKGVRYIPLLLDLLKMKGVSDFIFVMIGDGPLSGYIEGLASKYENISYLGYVSDDKKVEILFKSQVLVSFSVTERFFISGMEALASGTPVVAINNAGVREYIKEGENGYLVTTLEEMAEKIKSLCDIYRNNYGTYAEFVNRCKESSMNYSWEKVVDMYENMFSNVVKLFDVKGNDS